MGTSSSATIDLHGILTSLCFNTAWKYAVFWKLKHRARMVLTWEDGYYDNCEQHDSLENKCSSEIIESLHGGRYSHDPLGLAVAKMSYHVYSLGEGIVGQVAVTGKHQWIFSDHYDTNSCSSLEQFQFCDGWQSQISAGIRTIAVVAVVPHGVVQLGSLNKVTEDMKLVTHIREVFAALNDISVGHVTSKIQCSMKGTLSVPDLPTKSLAAEINPNLWHNLGEDKGPDVQLSMFSHVEKHNDGSFFNPFLGMQPKIGDGVVNKNEGIQLSKPGSDGSTKILQPKSNVINLDHQNQIGIHLMSDGMSKGESSGWKDLGVVSEKNGIPISMNSFIDSINLCNVALQGEKFEVDRTYFPSNPLESVFGDQVKLEVCIDSYQNGMLHAPEISDMELQKELETLQNQTEFNHLDPSDTSLKFSAVSELHEALGPAFLKKDVYNDREPESTVDGETHVMPDVMSGSHLMFDSGSENLLDAVVASVCYSGRDVKSERSFCQSIQSLLTTEKKPGASSRSKNTINSVTHSINQSSLVEEDAKQCLSSSEACGALSSKGLSSTCPSTCSEQLDRSSEPTKNNKKRSRTGENGRPRPRDRQLIQDRIKELRELVPNGSKCSIDSLLERTIKHMLFMQSITKHADKLSKCAESKMHQKGTSIQGSDYEQGSSWAVEVGSHLKVCSIIVENLNKNGQMLVEMMCEECSHFLEIAETIRSLGLTILKGVTEAHGDKTWICFVVEGQENRIMHRMDVLWSLVQVLQTKTACS